MDRERQRTRRALVELVNIPNLDSGWVGPAQDFLQKYEPMRPDSAMPDAEVAEFGKQLYEVWQAVLNRDRFELEQANARLNGLLAAGDPIQGEGPALSADLKRAKFIYKPRTFLQKLELELLWSARSLARCPECGNCFIKRHSRDKYCGSECSGRARNKSQKILMQKRRRHAKRHRS